MKKLIFNQKEAQWDAWERPYTRLGGGYFTLFDTGEIVICNLYGLRLDTRRHYADVGITLCNSGEITEYLSTPMQAPDGTKVAKVHVVYNASGATDQQLVAIDEARQEIYRVTLLKSGGHAVPKAVSDRCSLYYASYKHRPVCNPIRVVSPRKIDKDQQERAEETQLLCSARAALTTGGFSRGYNDKERYEKAPNKVYDTKVPIVDIVSALSDSDTAYIANEGVPTRKTRYEPYLKF